MANKPVEANIKCPFYISEKDNLLTCEGFIKNTCMVTRFCDARHKKEHLSHFCYYEDGKNCPMAKSLFEKYGAKSLLE